MLNEELRGGRERREEGRREGGGGRREEGRKGGGRKGGGRRGGRRGVTSQWAYSHIVQLVVGGICVNKIVHQLSYLCPLLLWNTKECNPDENLFINTRGLNSR